MNIDILYINVDGFHFFLQINMDFLQCQDFLVADLHQDGARHLIFGSDHQLEILRHARRWFIDGTFKVMQYHIDTCTLCIFLFETIFTCTSVSGRIKNYQFFLSAFTY